MGCKRLCIVDIGNWKCCMECEKHEECNILCDDLDQYEYMEECPDYVKEKNQMKYSEKLKPCPFCGKKAEFRTNTTETNGENFKYRFNIRCRNCEMNSSHIYGVEITFRNGDFVIIEDERDKAVEEWNRRAEDGKTD